MRPQKVKLVTSISLSRPVERVGQVGKLLRAPRRLGGAAVGQKLKCARMFHFEKKNLKIFSPEGPRENVWGPCENVSPGPAVALDGPVSEAAYLTPSTL